MTIEKLINKPDARIRELEKLVNQQAEQIDRLRGGRKRPFKPISKKLARGSFTRVVYGDVHGSYGNQVAINAFLADMRELQPKELINVGDLLSCDGFLAEHHTIGVVPQLDYSYEDDAIACNSFLDKLAETLPCATQKLIEGNHESRIGRWIAKATLRNPKDARMLERMYGVSAVLNLEKRNIPFIRRTKYYDGLTISGTIRLEPHALAQHGETVCGVNAARTLLGMLGNNVFFGHTHRLGAFYGENLDGPRVAINTGCLCDLRPLYGLTKCTGWCHGYALQFCCPNDGFLAIPVPIINGVSYLAPLLHMLRV